MDYQTWRSINRVYFVYQMREPENSVEPWIPENSMGDSQEWRERISCIVSPLRWRVHNSRGNSTENKQGLQSHRAATDLRQHVNALERQLNSYAAATTTPLFNIPVPSQTSSTQTLSSLSSLAAVKQSPLKQHAPLTSSNSVANCSASSHIKAAAVPSSSKEHRKLDRSVSEPADRSQARPAPPPNSSRYKTELCRPFEENGTCKYGDKCQFAHGAQELRSLTRHPKYKTELCRTFHTTGLCPYGPRCHFIHNSEDKKCLFPTLRTQHCSPISNQSTSTPKRTSPPPPTVANLDFTNFSLGSAGELSPPMSSASSGSPTSLAGGFFFDVPQSAPPVVTSSGFYYSTDYNPVLSPLSQLVSTPDFCPATPTQQQGYEAAEDSVMNILASELDGMSSLDIADGTKTDVAVTSKTEQNASVDVNRNLRLPIFSQLAHGSSPQ